MLHGSGGSLRRRLTHDAAALPLSARQQQTLQAFVLVACSLSFIGLSFVILHYIWERVVRRCLSLCRLRVWWRRRHPQQQSHHQHAFAVATPQYRDPLASATGAAPRDFNALLVFILSWIDLVSVLARMVGRTVLHEPTWCVVQASVIHASALASCLWTTCLSFNLYRWIVFGESDKKRRARLLPFLAFTFVPSALLVVYPLRAHKYGNATFYCWIMEPVLMFLHFYVFYVALAVLNVSLLLLIRMNLKQRVQWYDSDGTDATAAVIRGKALHYIVIFLLHRVPILVYRAFQIVGVQSFAVGVAVQFILNLDGFSNAVVYGGLFKKIPGVRFKHSPTLDPTPVRFSSESNYDFGSSSISIETDEYCASKTFKSNQKGLFAVEEEHCEHTADTSVSSVSVPTVSRDISSTNTGPSSSSCSEPATRTIDVQSCPLASPKQLPPAPGTGARASKTRRFAAGILDRASLERGADRVAKQQPRERSQSFSIFVSTFNMGEQNIPERELVEWIPIGHEIYVIGVQECMNLGDLQTKILHHLVSTTKQKYIHFSREIGKRATALGYHGYIALTVFVLEEAILQGRFEMPHREAMSKQAQEVYRGKSLLLFGRASNKGAVGISFRYNNTSFAFVTCHLASDSAGSSKKLTFRSKQSAAESMSGSASVDGSTATSSFLDSSDGSQRGRHHHQGRPPPSKFERRNQDAMEILQQLHLDEEDYGFSFPHLHHHSFVLGDLNYRMTRQYALPNEMLDMLTQVGVAKTRATKARSLSGVSSRSPPPPVLGDTYEAVATPTTLRGDVPVAPVVLNALIRDHDELTMLRESSQLFHGFTEAPITFFPTFRRIRGERLDSFDTASFQRNYSLMASGGGLRVPSYTDRIMHASLPGRSQQVRCLYYDSCEAVTSSDHKPVCAVFRVGATAEDAVADVNAKSTPQRMMTMPRMPSLFGTPPPVLCRNDSCEKAACDVLLKVEFRSIRWMDAVDVGVGNLFSRLENIEVGFLFPLPCEDVLSQQRKLQQVAKNLNWGESIDMATPLPFSTSISGSPTATNAGASSNFHVAAWNTFVEQGLRCPTRVAPVGKKHVALAIRTRSRTVQRSVSGPRSRSRVGSTAGGATNTVGGGGGGTSVSGFTTAGGAIPSVGNSFTSSGSYELSLGHGAFCIDKVGKRQDTVVPLTMGGNLVGRLHLRVTLQVRPK